MEKWKISNMARNEIISGNNVDSLVCTLPEPHYMPDMGDREWYNGCIDVMISRAKLIVTMQNAVVSIANKYGSDPLKVAEQIEPAIEALENLVTEIRREYGDSVNYQTNASISKNYYKAQEILSAIRSK